MISDSVCWKIDTRGQFVSAFSNKNYYDDDCDYGDDYDDYDIYIMMSVCLSEKSSLLGFSWFLVGFHGF